jgi:hypothetical protein
MLSENKGMQGVIPEGEHRVVFNRDNILGYIINRQVYVAVPPGNMYYGKSDDEINSMDFPEVHGSVIWSGNVEKSLRLGGKTFPELIQKSNHWIIVWAYNHFTSMIQMMSGKSYGVTPTLVMLTNECIRTCEEIIAQSRSSASSAVHEEELEQPSLHECIICTLPKDLNIREDNPNRVHVLSCGHTYHKHCIGSWLQSHQDCPICREPVTSNKALFLGGYQDKYLKYKNKYINLKNNLNNK